MLPNAQNTSTMITFLLVFFLLLRRGFTTTASVIQNKALQTFTAGQTITLECSVSKTHENYFSWFKQTLGEAPKCILTLYSDTLTPIFYGEFKNDTRLTAQNKENHFTLIIKEAKPLDAGIYYCATRDYDLMTFSNGLYLSYSGENTRQPHIKQFVSGLDSSTSLNKLEFDPGDSANLHCSLITERCAGNHSVYWFRYESGDSHPGIIYKHRNRDDQCEKSSEEDSRAQSCIYNLPIKNLALTDAGTYYCAVALCGEMLLGNGSRLEIRESSEFTWTNVQILVLVATNILCWVIITILLCMRAQKRQQILSETQPLQITLPSSPANEGGPEDLSYATVNFTGRNSDRREIESSSNTHVVYATARAYSLKEEFSDITC